MNEINPENPSSSPAPAGRHGCLTAYLIFIIIVNSALALTYLLGSGWIQSEEAKIPHWAFWALALCGAINVVAAVALLRWKRWGFWAFVASALISVGINLSIGLGLAGLFGSLFGILVLYGVLQIGQERKAWHQLR